MDETLRKQIERSCAYAHDSTPAGEELRARLRRTSSPRAEWRQVEPNDRILDLVEAGRALRPLIGMVFHYEVPEDLEFRLLEASNATQRERRKLRKMLP